MERRGITSLLLDQKWNVVKADDIKTEGLATTSTSTYILSYSAHRPCLYMFETTKEKDA